MLTVIKEKAFQFSHNFDCLLRSFGCFLGYGLDFCGEFEFESCAAIIVNICGGIAYCLQCENKIDSGEIANVLRHLGIVIGLDDYKWLMCFSLEQIEGDWAMIASHHFG